MKEQFCNYDISLRLKNLGFDEKCFAIYDAYQDNRLVYLCEDGRNPSGTIKTNASMDFSCLAPIYQQVIGWFREKYDIHFSFHYNPRTKKYAMWIEGPDEILRDYFAEVDILYSPKFNTYDECREQSILKAIKILEENE